MKILPWIMPLIFLVGGFIAGRFSVDDTPRIISKTETISKPIIRNYAALPATELTDRLKAYDTGVFKIDGALHNNVFRVDAVLSERTANREFTLSIGQGGGYKFYIAAGAVGICAGAYLTYKLLH